MKDKKTGNILHATPKKMMITSADKGYDDGENHEYLKQNNIRDAIILKDTRINKKDTNKEPWIEIANSIYYKYGTRRRKETEKVY